MAASAGCALLASCASLRPDPAAVAQDRSGHAAATAARREALTGFAGYYAGVWTPAPGGSCAAVGPVARDMLVEASVATSGVNYPLRGFVQPDGVASLSYGRATLVGRFGRNDFVGRAETGDRCDWTVALARLPPVGRATGAAPLPAADIAQGEVPDAPAREADPMPDDARGR